MRPLTVEELRALLAKHDPPCISLYMPTSRTSPTAVKENRLRFEGLLKKAREKLGSAARTAEASSVFTPLQALSDEGFWQRQLDGLAVFRSPDYGALFQVPMAFQESVVAAESFHVRPLLRALQADQRYFLLNLSQGAVSFFTGSARGVAPLDLRSLPVSLTDALGIEEREREIGFHSAAGHSGQPIYHGWAKSDTSRDEDLLRFFRIVDQALWDVLRDDRAPLVIAAPVRLLPMYRSVSRYAHVAQEGMHGNFDGASLEELHARAWPIVQQHVKAREEEVLERYKRLMSRRRTLDELGKVALATVEGRVRELLLERDAKIAGKLALQSGGVEVAGGASVEDVLEDLAEAVLLRGGEVYAFEQERMPTRSPVAATLRW